MVQVGASVYVQQSESEEDALTVIKCLFTHFVKVFFCTRSRSSARHTNNIFIMSFANMHNFTAVNDADALYSVGSTFLWDEKQQSKGEDGPIDLSLGGRKKNTSEHARLSQAASVSAVTAAGTLLSCLCGTV